MLTGGKRLLVSWSSVVNYRRRYLHHMELWRQSVNACDIDSVIELCSRLARFLFYLDYTCKHKLLIHIFQRQFISTRCSQSVLNLLLIALIWWFWTATFIITKLTMGKLIATGDSVCLSSLKEHIRCCCKHACCMYHTSILISACVTFYIVYLREPMNELLRPLKLLVNRLQDPSVVFWHLACPWAY